jgi:hypothetical protein
LERFLINRQVPFFALIPPPSAPLEIVALAYLGVWYYTGFRMVPVDIVGVLDFLGQLTS